MNVQTKHFYDEENKKLARRKKTSCQEARHKDDILN
jgi:hypothetical protein